MKRIAILAGLLMAVSAHAEVSVFDYTAQPGVRLRLMDKQGKCGNGTLMGQLTHGRDTHSICWMYNDETERILVRFTESGVKRAFALEDLEAVRLFKNEVKE